MYLTGIHSGQDPNAITYKIFLFLPHEDPPGQALKLILTNQLTKMHQTGLPTSSLGLETAYVEAITTHPVPPELDDLPIVTTIAVIPTQLDLCPYAFNITLPTFSPMAYGLLLLASRQVKWTATIPDTLLPYNIPNNIRTLILQQVPTVIRAHTKPPPLSRDSCTITSPAFTTLTPLESYRYFRASALHTLR